MPTVDVTEQKVQSEIDALKREFDHRFAHFKVEVRLKGDTASVTGAVHYPQLETSVSSKVSKALPDIKIVSKLKVLTRDWPLRFAQVMPPSVMGLFIPGGDPRDATTELLCGQMVRLFMRQGEWVLAQAPDGYLGWLPRNTLKPATSKQYLEWSHGRRWRLIRPWREGRQAEFRVGSELPMNAQGKMVIPGRGPVANLAPGEVVDLSHNPLRERVVEIAHSYLGVPYLWGGRTDRGLDCSGFVQMIYARVGIALPRDANQQSDIGLLVGHLPDYSDLMPGDLLFFMSCETAKIFHVGISLGGDLFIHSESKKGVSEARLKTQSALPGHPYTTHFCFARRVFL